MICVPIEGLSYNYGDNMSVINNAQQPVSSLNKKSSSHYLLISSNK